MIYGQMREISTSLNFEKDYKPSIVNRNQCYELSPSKQLSSIFGTHNNSKNIVVNVKQNRNSRNSNRKIINCNNTKEINAPTLSNMSNISGISSDNKDNSIPAHSGASTARNHQSVEHSLTTG